MENLSFEDAMKELESIVSELETGDLSLDKSIEKFKKGVELSNYCNKLLENAEKTVTVLVEKSDEMVEENFVTE